MASCPDECPNLCLFSAKLMFMSLNREWSCLPHKRGKFVSSQPDNSFGPGFTMLLLNPRTWGRDLDRTRGKCHSFLFRQLHFCEAQLLGCALNTPIGSGPLADKEGDLHILWILLEFRQEARNIVSPQFLCSACPEAEFRHQNGSKHIRVICVGIIDGKAQTLRDLGRHNLTGAR